jgi:DUF1680 family protein
MKRRLDYMVAELAECQRGNGDGYVGGVPRSKELWQAVAAGQLKVTGFGPNDRWVPWYKPAQDLRWPARCIFVAGNEDAKRVLIALADWCVAENEQAVGCANAADAPRRAGRMNEVLAEVFAITKDEKYLAARATVLRSADPRSLSAERDDLTGKHANTQIPKVIGFERIANLSPAGDDAGRFDRAAAFFWETVTRRRCVAIGGNSVGEHFNRRTIFDQCSKTAPALRRATPTTCSPDGGALPASSAGRVRGLL